MRNSLLFNISSDGQTLGVEVGQNFHFRRGLGLLHTLTAGMV